LGAVPVTLNIKLAQVAAELVRTRALPGIDPGA